MTGECECLNEEGKEVRETSRNKKERMVPGEFLFVCLFQFVLYYFIHLSFYMIY